MSLIDTMINKDTLEEAKKGKVAFIDIDDINENQLNLFSIENIEALAESIEDDGLLQPLVVYKENKMIKLHSGHRRFQAIKHIFEQDKKISFFGKELAEEVPVIYIDNKNDELENSISMIRSNAYRSLNDEEKANIIDIALDYVKKLEQKGEKPKGRTREIISSITGISDTYIKNYLANKNKQEEDLGAENPKEQKKENDSAKKVKKTMEKLNELLEDFSISSANYNDYMDIKELSMQLQDKILEILQ